MTLMVSNIEGSSAAFFRKSSTRSAFLSFGYTLIKYLRQICFSFLFFLVKSNMSFQIYTAWKVSTYGVFSGPYFPIFGLNTEIYSVNLRIQSAYRKICTRKNSVFGHFSRSVRYFGVTWSKNMLEQALNIISGWVHFWVHLQSSV